MALNGSIISDNHADRDNDNYEFDMSKGVLAGSNGILPVVKTGNLFNHHTKPAR